MNEQQSYKGKKLLLLSGPMGTGHVQAANALKAWAHRLYPEIDVVHHSAEEYMSPMAIFVYIKFYHYMLRHFAFLWRYIYQCVNRPQSKPSLLGIFFEKLGFSAKEAILKLVDDYQPDYIICTHFLAGNILADARARGKVLPITAIVITDFSIHWAYVHPEIDLFFVTTASMALILHLRGIGRYKIFVSGCPTQPMFAEEPTREEIEVLRKDLSLPDGDFVMVMMGGESIGRVEAISQKLLECFPQIHVLAMTGKNEKLFERLESIKGKQPFKNRLIPIPFTTRVRDYMALSFVLISKPGGIFTTEGWSMNRPLVLIDPIPGHEEKNAIYLSSQGVAAMANSIEELAYIPMNPNATWIEIIKRNQKLQPMGDAGEKILDIVLHESKDVKPHA